MEAKFGFLKQPTEMILEEVQHLIVRGARSGMLPKLIKQVKDKGEPIRLDRKAADATDGRILKFLDNSPAIIQKVEETFRQELPGLAEYWEWTIPFIACSLEYHHTGLVPPHVFVGTEEQVMRKIDQARETEDEKIRQWANDGLVNMIVSGRRPK